MATSSIMHSPTAHAQGNPQRIAVVRHLGMGLDQKAIEAVRQYRFKPATMRGQGVPVDINTNRPAARNIIVSPLLATDKPGRLSLRYLPSSHLGLPNSRAVLGSHPSLRTAQRSYEPPCPQG